MYQQVSRRDAHPAQQRVRGDNGKVWWDSAVSNKTTKKHGESKGNWGEWKETRLATKERVH